MLTWPWKNQMTGIIYNSVFAKLQNLILRVIVREISTKIVEEGKQS